MRFIADLHIHSKYSRATSKDMDLEHIAEWARLKGIDLVGSGDFTHPLWFEELKDKLRQDNNGLYEYKGIKFILTAEVSNMYAKDGRARRIHTIIFAPSLEIVEKINKKLANYGNVVSDGRPIFGFDVKDIVRLCLDISGDCLMVPAHCLLPKAYLHSNHNLKKMEDIKRGDIVYTHKGRWRKVKDVYKRSYKGKIVHIRPYYFSCGLKTTPEHPFYAVRTFKKCPTTSGFCKPLCSERSKCRRKYFEKYKPEWIMAKDLKNSDILIYPRFTVVKDTKTIKISDFIKGGVLKKGRIKFKGSRSKTISNTIKIDKDFCRLAGYYLAEGYTDSRDSISFCFRADEQKYIEDVRQLMLKIFFIAYSRTYKRSGTNAIELVFFSKVLSMLFGRLFYGNAGPKKHFNKRLPEWMLQLSLEKQAEIFKGWWYGDNGYTSSVVLMNQMKTILLRLGVIPSILIDKAEYRNAKENRNLNGRRIIAKNDNYNFSNLSFFEDRFNLLKEAEFKKYDTKMRRRHGWIDEEYIYIPIRDIKSETYNGSVYNLEVEGDNSYVAEFATVHNCWTPWFSVFGSNSGFDSVEECFEEETKNIYALETGLSSDPAMNWRWSALDRYNLISNSDAHSPAKLGREVNVFDTELSYRAITQTLKGKDKKRFLFTVEFFPQEGKYHFDGHRNCGVRLAPSETKAHHNRCPKCGRLLTVGVMSRVEELADRPEGFVLEEAVPFRSIVPLIEIIAEARQKGTETQGVFDEYRKAIGYFGSEFKVLLDAEEGELFSHLPPKIAEAIIRVRRGELIIEPGYDGVYGTVKIFKEEELKQKDEKQLELF